MALNIIDPSDFLPDGIFRQDAFISNVDRFDFGALKEKRVLVRGCQSTVIPPWAFMYLTGKLVPYAKTVLFGNEHDNVVVFRHEQ